MKKKHLNGLSLNKKTISSLNLQSIVGGTGNDFTWDEDCARPTATTNDTSQYCGNTTVPAPTLAGRSVCVCR